MDDESTILWTALTRYGPEQQTKKLFEEMAELTVATCHYGEGRGSAEAVIEEIADVEIMLDQLKMIVADEGTDMPRETIRDNMSALVAVARAKKIERLRKKLGL